jgi:hypothetical protein
VIACLKVAMQSDWECYKILVDSPSVLADELRAADSIVRSGGAGAKKDLTIEYPSNNANNGPATATADEYDEFDALDYEDERFA